MRQNLKKILHAAFVMPWTTGLIKEYRNGGFSKHDGSIAGVVILTTIIIMIFELMVFFPKTTSRIVMTVLLIIAIFTLISMSLSACKNKHWTMPRRSKGSHSLKLKFLWLFCVANITFEVVKFAIYSKCDQLPDVLLFYISTWIFQILQTFFLHYFSKFIFNNVLCLYYGFLVLVVTNFSLWTHRTIFTYHEAKSFLNISDISGNVCNDTKSFVPMEKFKPFLDPVSLEYCLLCVILLSEMWPRAKYPEHQSRQLQESSSKEETEEHQWLLRCNSNVPTRTVWNRKSIIVLFIGVLYMIVFLVIQTLFLNIDQLRKNYLHVAFAFYVCGNFIRIPLTIKCFYAFSAQLRPKSNVQTVTDMKHVIILVSSMATCGYIIAECVENLRHGEVKIILNAIFRVIGTVMQTSFILQMKQYKRVDRTNTITSIQNTFLFMCCINFSFWFSYTFMSPQYTVKLQRHFFEITSWLKIKHFWFPFIIFYHFECFISFYDFFRK